MRTLLTLVTAALLAVGAPAAAVALPLQPTAGIANTFSIGLIDAPGQPYIVATPNPGDTVTRQVRVTNNTGAAQDISVYAGPATMDNGKFNVENAGETNALSTWTSVDKPTVSLGNGAAKDVTVTIKVPSTAPSATLYGSIWAAIGNSRVGVRMDVTVGGTNGPAADFLVTDLIPQRQSDGTAVVVASVTNTGNHSVDMTGTLHLTGGPGGQWLDAVPAQPTTLAAGARGTVVFVIPNSATLPNGPWTADTRLKNGYFTHELKKPITFPNAASPATGSLGSLGSGSLGSLGFGS
ncbi:hypothetical protein B2J88_23135 [Rhodococcus sp. SRB_17]|nr:hypothetical protein [Rhodococcus sp. SRB_17]